MWSKTSGSLGRVKRIRRTLFASVIATAALGFAAPGASAVHYGIDVSVWQGTINWTQVAASGQRFAIIKATQGMDYVNPNYARDFREAKANGMFATGYHFALAQYNNPEAQADKLVNTSGYVADGKTLPPMLDIEFGNMVNAGNCFGLSPAGLSSWIKRFVDRVNLRIGRNPMIYTNAYWWNDCVKSTAFGHLPLVIANYGNVSAPSPLPMGWSTYAIWQFTETGRVPGVSGNVDRDRTRDDNTLAQLTGGSTPPPPPPTGQYTVDTHADAPGYVNPGVNQVGTLKKGTNYVYCRRIGPRVTVGSSTNHWWLRTDLDTGQKNHWVNAYYLAKWGNDEAKDNSGATIPLCDQPYGTIGAKWNAIGGGGSVVGWPTLPEMAAQKGGRFQQFERGIILWKPNVAYVIRGDILQNFWANGGENKLGFPTMDEAPAGTAPNGTKGQYQYFDDGVILWSAATGAKWVHGAIEQKFASSGREAALGYPTTEETADGSGRKQEFQKATIRWNASTGATVTMK